MNKLIILLVTTFFVTSCASGNKNIVAPEAKLETREHQIESCSRYKTMTKDQYIFDLVYMRCLDDCYEGEMECDLPLSSFCRDFLSAFIKGSEESYLTCMNNIK